MIEKTRRWWRESGYQRNETRNLWRNVLTRRGLSHLESSDDYIPKVTGVTRAEVRWAAGLPFTVNAALVPKDRPGQRLRNGSLD